MIDDVSLLENIAALALFILLKRDSNPLIIRVRHFKSFLIDCIVGNTCDSFSCKKAGTNFSHKCGIRGDRGFLINPLKTFLGPPFNLAHPCAEKD